MDTATDKVVVESQSPLLPLQLDVSGDPEVPVPNSLDAPRCECCGFWAQRLWDGARSAYPVSHAVCTLCYLAGHLDSATAAHGRLAYLPGMAMADVHHLQRRALLAMLDGTKAQRTEGLRVMRWLMLHAREVEGAFETARAGEFAHAMNRLPPSKRNALRNRLPECALLLPADVFEGPDNISLLLASGKTTKQMLATSSWSTYTRSDLYV